jgi:hypothetical protein
MSVTIQIYEGQTSPTATLSTVTGTTVTFADKTSPTATFTEKSPTLEGTFYGAGDYDLFRYQARDLILGRR